MTQIQFNILLTKPFRNHLIKKHIQFKQHMSLQLVSNSSELEEYHPSDPLLKHTVKTLRSYRRILYYTCVVMFKRYYPHF